MIELRHGLILAILACCLVLPARAQYSVRVDHAGATTGEASGGTYHLRGTVGQPGARISGDGEPFYLGEGFWYASRNENVTLPVELTSFEATGDGEGVHLAWATASETRNAGFEIERHVPTGGAPSRRDRQADGWTTVGFVEGAGTTTAPQRYRYNDQNVPFTAGHVTYRLKQVDLDGTAHYSDEVEVERAAPERLTLHGNYPNPFREQTTIRYELPQTGKVRIVVYDVLGRRMATLVDERQAAGRKEITFDAARLPSGVYFVRLAANGRVRTRRLTLVR